MNVTPFVAHLQATVVSEPRQRPLDHIPESSKSAAVDRIPCLWGDQRDDSASLYLVDEVGGAVDHIRLKDVRSEPRPSGWPLDGKYCVEEIDGRKRVVDVSGSDLRHQRDSLSFRYDMTFAASFPSVGGVTLDCSNSNALSEAHPIIPRCAHDLRC